MEALQTTSNTSQDSKKRIAYRGVSDKTIHVVCNRLSQGEWIRDICKEPGMPSYARLVREIKLNPTWATMYRNAREAQAELFLELMVQAGQQADDKSNANAARVRAETYKWFYELTKGVNKKLELTIKPIDYANKLQTTSKVAVPEKLQHKARPDKYQVEDAVEAEIVEDNHDKA